MAAPGPYGYEIQDYQLTVDVEQEAGSKAIVVPLVVTLPVQQPAQREGEDGFVIVDSPPAGELQSAAQALPGAQSAPSGNTACGAAGTLAAVLPSCPASASGPQAGQPSSLQRGCSPCPPPGAPYPVLIFLNGFQSNAGQYAAYADRMASWGYACLQYSAPFGRVVVDRVELTWLQPLLAWAAAAQAEPGGALQGKLDLSRVFIAGHSRGGKLAALHWAAAAAAAGATADGKPPERVAALDDGSGGEDPLAATAMALPRLIGAYLIDPVDNTKYSPPSEDYPSACQALKKAQAAVGIMGAGVTGPANPDGSNWRSFWSAMAGSSPPSSLNVIPGAGHTKFADYGAFLNWLLDKALCGGSASRQAVLDATCADMLCWFQRVLAAESGAARSAAAVSAC